MTKHPSSTTSGAAPRPGVPTECARRLRRTLPLMIALVLAQIAASAQSLTVDYTIGTFVSAVSLSVNIAGELVVLDAGANACMRFAHDGTELSRVQGTGWGTTEFDSPTDVSAAFPLAIYVADGKNKRMQQFDKDLHYVQTLDDIQAAGGQTIDGPFRPIASAQSAQGDLFVLDADGTRIIKFTTRLLADREFGTYKSGEGQLMAPTDLCMTTDGRVAASDGNRIVFFDQFGNYLSTQRGDSGDTYRALSASGSDIIAVGESAISIMHGAEGSPAGTLRITEGMILGEPRDGLRDAARTEAWWYVLTPKKILVCKRTAQ